MTKVMRMALYMGLLVYFLGAMMPQKALAMNEMDRAYVLKALQIMEGDWYNDAGQKVLSIHGDTINGCKVLSGWDFAGSSRTGVGEFRVQERTGERKLIIEWEIKKSPSDYITINDEQMLHKTPHYWYESIGGIHLGMSASAVERQLGEPTQIDRGIWHYAKQGLSITFAAGSVNGIILSNKSDLRFKESGLNCSDSPQAFAKAYGMDSIPWPREDYDIIRSIGHGEYLCFGKDMESIALTVYNN